MTTTSTPSNFNIRESSDPLPTVEPSTTEEQGYILYEQRRNVGGDSVDDLRNSVNFPSRPSYQELLTKLEAPAAIGNDYGTRMREYIYPPMSGDYHFWIAGDDKAEGMLHYRNVL